MESEKSSREKGIYKVTIVGSIVNFLLLVFKFFAGIAGHSAAMLADAVHSSVCDFCVLPSVSFGMVPLPFILFSRADSWSLPV